MRGNFKTTFATGSSSKYKQHPCATRALVWLGFGWEGSTLASRSSRNVNPRIWGASRFSKRIGIVLAARAMILSSARLKASIAGSAPANGPHAWSRQPRAAGSALSAFLSVCFGPWDAFCARRHGAMLELGQLLRYMQ